MNKLDLLNEINDIMGKHGTFKFKDINEEALSVRINSKTETKIDSLMFYGVYVREYEVGTGEYLSKGYHAYDILSIDILTQIFFLADSYRNSKIKEYA